VSGPDVLSLVTRMLVDRVPHNAALGLHVRHFGGGRAETTLPWAEHLVGDPRTGVLHGGAITSTIDATCGAAVFAGLRAPTPIATLDLRVDYLRPARPGEAVLCDATCDKVTRHVAFTRATAHHGDPREPIATAAGAFMVFRRGRAFSSETAAPAEPRAEAPAEETAEKARADIAFDDALAAARAGGDVDPLVHAIPYARFLGLRAEAGAAGNESARAMVMPFRARNVGDSSLPALHGGTLGALLEAAALFELFAFQASSSAPGEALPRTINVTFDFQRSGRPVDTFAVAEVIRAGRRVATVHARAWQDDPKAPVATAQMHALLAE
jgi:uncharacterized protein (TIGR00369 family)